MRYPNLAAEMKRNGMTAKDMAERLGVTASTVNRYQKRKLGVSVGLAKKIRDACFPGMRIDYLFQDINDMNEQDRM